MKKSTSRDTFTSKFGMVAAAAGSAVGLGNIWKFPYETGSNGGSVFLLIYIGFIILLGIPTMVAEFVIGRRGQANAYRSFKNIVPRSGWSIVGILGIVASFVILSFYSTVAGWTMEYVVDSFSIGSINSPLSHPDTYFSGFIAEPMRPILWQALFLLLTAVVVIGGVSSGIEKASKYLMPILVVLIIGMCVRSVTLNGASEGLEFLFKPDFSKVTRGTILNAMGQAFFSLSLGMGIMLTYGSYIKKKDNMMNTAVYVAVADTVIAILAGVMIFPAVFAFGVEPASGPSLVFITLPHIFGQMFLGNILSFMFFTLLAVAALTSTISLFEVIVAFAHEQFKLRRSVAALICMIAVLVLGIPATLSMGKLSGIQLIGKNLFDFLDYAASNIMLPLGALLAVLFIGWFQGQKFFRDELSNGGMLSMPYFNVLNFILKFIAPVLIAVILVTGILSI